MSLYFILHSRYLNCNVYVGQTCGFLLEQILILDVFVFFNIQ